MGKIFCIIGKSSTGKDTFYREILKEEDLALKTIVPYTTRPRRAEEEDGISYYFCDEKKVDELERAGKIIELRAYQTVCGVWKYFTVDDGQINLATDNYLLIGTLESFQKIRDYFGKENVVPIYIEVEDRERLTRALNREKQQETPKYEEMCRRFLADAKDFSEENIKAAGIKMRFINHYFEETLQQIISYIRDEIERG